ncbi:MAG TPA: NADH-quinone oxidoreductase subunit L [Thermodesulfobacteriota bacterium]|mgnify:CR=1 FL=1|nr:NADH-quinone oxidoreductase subunit L [Thermodesulfobacteriota bacterium]
MIEFVWLIPLFPLLGVIIIGCLGARFPKRLIGLVGTLTAAGSLALSCRVFVDVLHMLPHERFVEVVLWEWLPAGTTRVDVGFLVDPLCLVMLLLVCGVSFCVHIYSMGYTATGFRRYILCLNLFVFFMLLLISSNSFLFMLVGWQGTSLCASLLSAFWYRQQAAVTASRKAFVFDRIGDYSILLGILLIAAHFGSLDFRDVLPLAAEKLPAHGLAAVLISLLLMVGALVRSSQLPFSLWLPDAIQGPMPGHALIHAATLGASGIYVLARCSTLFGLAPLSLWAIAAIGAGTAFYGAAVSLTQFDIRRIFAYATVSQLGYMVLACGSGAYAAGIFHLIAHAVFQTIVFLACGSIIYSLDGETDLRNMGGLWRRLPWTYRMFWIGTLSLSGIVPFAGFFSRDAVLWAAFQKHPVLWIAGVITVFVTTFYAFRALFVIFHGRNRPNDHADSPMIEPPAAVIALVVLAVTSLVGGVIGLPEGLGASNWLERFLMPVFQSQASAAPAALPGPEVNLVAASHAGGAGGSSSAGLLHGILTGISLMISLLSLGISYFFYRVDPLAPVEIAALFGRVYRTLYHAWYLAELSDSMVVQPLVKVSGWLWRTVEMRLNIVLFRLGGVLIACSRFFERIQTGLAQHYALLILAGIVLVLAYYFLS